MGFAVWVHYIFYRIILKWAEHYYKHDFKSHNEVEMFSLSRPCVVGSGQSKPGMANKYNLNQKAMSETTTFLKSTYSGKFWI